MSVDRTKEELQWLRTAFPVAVAIMAALTAYIVQPTTTRVMIGVAGLAAVMVASGVALIMRRIDRLLTEL